MAVNRVTFAHTLGKRRAMEFSTFDVTATFQAGETKTAPSGDVAYKIVNPKTRKILRDWTTISSPASQETITVALADNTLANQSQIWERRELYIRDASLNILGKFTWTVDNGESDAAGTL